MTDLDTEIPTSQLPWSRAWLAAFWPFGCEPDPAPDTVHPVGEWKIVGTGPRGLAVIRPVCPAAEA